MTAPGFIFSRVIDLLEISSVSICLILYANDVPESITEPAVSLVVIRTVRLASGIEGFNMLSYCNLNSVFAGTNTSGATVYVMVCPLIVKVPGPKPAVSTSLAFAISVPGGKSTSTCLIGAVVPVVKITWYHALEFTRSFVGKSWFAVGVLVKTLLLLIVATGTKLSSAAVEEL